MTLPAVSIIIPCRNEALYIKKCVDSILSQNYGGKIEAIVVDGMSDDGTREILTDMKSGDERIKLVDNLLRTTPQALNIGVNNASGNIFIILGGHAFLDSDFILNNVETLGLNDDIGCSGGLINNIYENKTGKIISIAMSSPFGVGNATFRTGGNAGYVDTVAFGAYYKSVHNKIGGFDEDLVRNQDDDYNYRIHKAGYKIYFNPKIQSHYYVRGSYRKLFKQYFQYGYWKVYVAKKHKAITTIRQLVPLFFVLGIIAGALLSMLFSFFIWIYLLGISAYVLLAVFFGLKASKKMTDALRVAFVFPILHFSYGWGYLQGIVSFLVLKKKPSEKSKSVTRG